jgi:hypothetical protein
MILICYWLEDNPELFRIFDTLEDSNLLAFQFEDMEDLIGLFGFRFSWNSRLKYNIRSILGLFRNCTCILRDFR